MHRHQSDYAALLLVDRRYSTPRISSKLPKWIGQDINSILKDRWTIGLLGLEKACNISDRIRKVSYFDIFCFNACQVERSGIKVITPLCCWSTGGIRHRASRQSCRNG
jgi:hypothetical protein